MEFAYFFITAPFNRRLGLLLQYYLSQFQNPVGARLRFNGLALGKGGQRPAFSSKLRKLFQNLTFWNSLI
jgi:hypothetical protein